MGLNNGEVGAISHELLGAQAHVWNHMFQFINSMSLKCAVQLGIPDVIHNHGQPISLSELVARLNVHPSKAHFISRLMRILVHSDFFAQHDHVHHDRDDAEEEVAVVKSDATKSRERKWIATNRTTPYELRQIQLIGIESGYGASSSTWWVDGSANPDGVGAAEWILHDWNDEESVKILKKCREAIFLNKNEGRKKKIIIIDIVVGYADNKTKVDKKSIETQLMFDMLMMSTITGKERSESEWEKIFLAAGFSHYNITHTLGLRSLIEVYP
ncbi:hypothetical protein C1H46_009854 [Malus baccata]|uniref:O-methyltransferase domain-containing protein n=1 Tax=Malus baccata TaxID=106549 RepID=A0A540N0G6_MALBA|nr:hypothetical protein C1H46_009854 [Malus baccata]